MERGSDKHSPMVDDQLKHETEGLVRSGHSTHAQEWKDPEPAGEDQPEADRAPDTTLVGGTPAGMTGDDVERRAELASYLGKEIWPADRGALLDRVLDADAPDHIVDLVRRVPDGSYDNVSDVWSALGGGTEQQRF